MWSSDGRIQFWSEVEQTAQETYAALSLLTQLLGLSDVWKEAHAQREELVEDIIDWSGDAVFRNEHAHYRACMLESSACYHGYTLTLSIELNLKSCR